MRFGGCSLIAFNCLDNAGVEELTIIVTGMTGFLGMVRMRAHVAIWSSRDACKLRFGQFL